MRGFRVWKANQTSRPIFSESVDNSALESARKKTKPRVVDLYDVFCGVLYILKSGCQWRMLPANFPKWRTCNEYFRIWSEKKNGEDSILDQILKKTCAKG